MRGHQTGGRGEECGAYKRSRVAARGSPLQGSSPARRWRAASWSVEQWWSVFCFTRWLLGVRSVCVVVRHSGTGRGSARQAEGRHWLDVPARNLESASSPRTALRRPCGPRRPLGPSGPLVGVLGAEISRKPFGATAMACAPWPLACPLNGYWLAGIEAAVVHLMPFNRHVHARADQLETLALFASLTKSKNALHVWRHGPRVCPRHGTKVDFDKSLNKCPNLAIYIFLFWWLFWAGIDCFTFHELTFEYRKAAGTNGQPLSLRFVFRTFG